MKKERILRSIQKKMKFLVYTLLMVTVISCSSDDNSSSSTTPDGKNLKLTITINGLTSEDYVSFVAVGSANSSSSDTTLWKVNGATLTNEQAVSLGKNDFIGSTKTYVIESVKSLKLAQLGMQFLATGTRTYTISYKAEVNGKVVKEDSNVAVTAQKDYTHDYSY
ncbi:MAG: hypothetical protein ABI554_06770 [Flavobacterium sp.]